MVARTVRPDALTLPLSYGRGAFCRNISPHSRFKRAIYISVTFDYCYVITLIVVSRCQRPFSLSAPVRLLLALVLVLFIGLAVRWAVALP